MLVVRTEQLHDSVAVFLRLEEGDPRRTSDAPGLVDAVLRALPGLYRHTCTQGGSGLLVKELADTELAHLIEHVALEVLVMHGAPRSITGETRWDRQTWGPGVYRVLLGTADAVAAGSAVTRSVEIVRAAREGHAEDALRALAEKPLTLR
ncbi:MAG: hypothetical protein Kow0056_12730 [Coriobacteriia bacterium]